MGEMVLSRGVFLPSTVLGLPPVVMAGLDKVVGWGLHSQKRLLCQALTVVGSLGVMLPLALALFPQRGEYCKSHYYKCHLVSELSIEHAERM